MSLPARILKGSMEFPFLSDIWVTLNIYCRELVSLHSLFYILYEAATGKRWVATVACKDLCGIYCKWNKLFFDCFFSKLLRALFMPDLNFCFTVNFHYRRLFVREMQIILDRTWKWTFCISVPTNRHLLSSKTPKHLRILSVEIC